MLTASAVRYDRFRWRT